MDEEQVRKIYNEEYIGKHIGAYTLSKKYNKDLYAQFHKYNLPLRNDVEKNKKYTCDSTFFNVIDTEEKAYWLGFLMADGFITIMGNGKRMGVSIKISDIEHLEKLKIALNTETPIHTYEVKQGYKIGTQYCRLIIADIELVDALMSHGCIQQKSNILLPPTGIPNSLRRHWIRGFMDGNGSISVTKTQKIDSYTIRFTSTDDVLNWIMDILIDDNIITRRYPFSKRKPEHVVSSFEFGGNYLSKKYCDYIYDGATVYLQRKYDRYIELSKMLKQREENKNKIYHCDICGKEGKDRYHEWVKDDEYKGLTLCNKHYLQLHKHNRIKEDKKKYCDICGDQYGRLIHCGHKHIDYYGLTMCRKHYEQLDVYGKITDKTKGWHKNE